MAQDTVDERGVQAFHGNIDAMVSLAQRAGSRVTLLSFASLYEENAVGDQLARLQAVQHQFPWLSIEGILDGLEWHNGVLREVSLARQTGWVDMASLFPRQLDLFADNIHFTDAVNARFTEILAAELARELGGGGVM